MNETKDLCEDLSPEELRADRAEFADKAVTFQMHELAMKMSAEHGSRNRGELVGECRSAAIEAYLQCRPDLAAKFIILGAELMILKADSTLECALSRPTNAISQFL